MLTFKKSVRIYILLNVRHKFSLFTLLPDQKSDCVKIKTNQKESTPLLRYKWDYPVRFCI